MLIATQTYSQCPKYNQAIEAGKIFLTQKAFDKAIVEFQAAQIAARECKQSKGEPAILLKKAFDGIQKQRDRAIEAGKKALLEKQSAIKAKEQAELARLQADSSRAKANRLRNLAVEQRKKAIILKKDLSKKNDQSKKLVKGIYFYGNNYGLAYNKKSQRFYYFDTLGKAHFQEENLSFYQANQFNRFGYARVKVEKTTLYPSYIDTLGTLYPIAEKKYQINEKTIFIHFSDKNLNRIPSDVWRKGIIESPLGDKTSSIKSLELRNNHIYRISNKIQGLKQLEVLDLADNSLWRLPKSIIELKELRIVNLSNETSYLDLRNQIKRLPAEVGNLKKLQRLNMNYHQISKLPSSFSSLQGLEELNLRRNNFRHFPLEVLDLVNLKKLDLSGNKIKKLPSNIFMMKSLEVLNVTGNRIDENEITNLKKSLPNLRIIERDSTLKKRGHLLSFGLGINLGDYNLRSSSSIINLPSSQLPFIMLNYSISYQIGEYGLSYSYKAVNLIKDIYISEDIMFYLLVGETGNNFELKAFINRPSMIKTSLGIGGTGYPFYSSFINNDSYRVSHEEFSDFYFTGSIEYLFTKKRKQNHGGFQLSAVIFQKIEGSLEKKNEIGEVIAEDKNIELFLARLSIGYTYYFGRILFSK